MGRGYQRGDSQHNSRTQWLNPKKLKRSEDGIRYYLRARDIR